MPARCTSCGEMDYSDLGDIGCFCSTQDLYRNDAPQLPTIEEMCDPHPFHCCKGDPRGASPEDLLTLGTCYCGAQSYPVDSNGDLLRVFG